MGEVPMEEVPMEMPEPAAIEEASPYAPTMISSTPAEVSEIIAAAQAAKMEEETPVEMEASAEVADETPAELEEPSAPTFVGIPDPLGMSESAQIPSSEPAPPHIPAYNEPVIIPTPTTSSDAPEAPKDNRRIWIIGGVGCIALCCLCSLTVVAINVFTTILNSR